MQAPWQLLAQAEKPPALDWRLVWATLGIVAAILIGAAIIALVDRWRKRPFQEKLSASDQLAQFRLLYERGQLKPEEFERIRALLTERMKKELEASAAAVPKEPSPSPPSPLPGEDRGEESNPPV